MHSQRDQEMRERLFMSLLNWRPTIASPNHHYAQGISQFSTPQIARSIDDVLKDLDTACAAITGTTTKSKKPRK